jgi:hypothetical protein
MLGAGVRHQAESLHLLVANPRSARALAAYAIRSAWSVAS